MMMENQALVYLAWTAFLTCLMWVPYILHMIMLRGFWDAVGYPTDPTPLAPWGQKCKAAHYNAVENLVVFAPLVIVASMLNVANDTTATAALVYLIARIVHYVVYTLAIPLARTLSFVAGWAATVVVAAQILF